MNAYLVGGAVRDRLLGVPVTDRDWVVVGHTVDDMRSAGFRQVGRDFPVFLHPQTHEEYALARTERKTTAGYHGFEVHASKDVTLEQDLQRRDLTINAIAEDVDGNLFDPFGGLQDIENRVLRHVSPAFSEDPVRLIRVARFAARLARHDFTIAPETLTLMRQLVVSGEIDTLVPERVWQEVHAALATQHPQVFFQTLRDVGALQVLLPELDKLFGTPQLKAETDCGQHTMQALQQSVKQQLASTTRFAVLCHDIGKGVTSSEQLPHHFDHEMAGSPLVEQLCQRLKAPAGYRDLAVLTCRYHGFSQHINRRDADTITQILLALDCLRKPDRFEEFLSACTANIEAYTSLDPDETSDELAEQLSAIDLMRQAAEVIRSVDAASIAKGQTDKSLVKQDILDARGAAVADFFAQ